MTDFIPTREAALARLDMFLPKTGRHYSSRRNYDLGPGNHFSVSTLSPYLRRRLITEREVVRRAVETHGAAGADKFISEVFWRTYFKGWLEHRPGVWSDYVQGRGNDLTAMAADPDLAARIADAEGGRTGIECFDAWARELIETGYLHNHARMWFASIWIFTLCLPWRIGADFFLRHLLDGDPASNTLSWRWVGGLHTKGKHYLADRTNIARFTEGRFAPGAGVLDDTAEPLEEAFDPGPALPVRADGAYDSTRPALLLLTEDDCLPEDFELGEIAGAATLHIATARSPRTVAPSVEAFDDGALADAAGRSGLDAAALRSVEELVAWADASGVDQVVTPFVCTGPTRDWLDAAQATLEGKGMTLATVRREWDEAVWPHATAGFFKVKKKIPRILSDLGIV